MKMTGRPGFVSDADRVGPDFATALEMAQCGPLHRALKELSKASLYGNNTDDDAALMRVLREAEKLGWIPPNAEYQEYLDEHERARAEAMK